MTKMISGSLNFAANSIPSLVFALAIAVLSNAQTAAPSGVATAQEAAATPAIAFDAVSIKLNKSGDTRMSHSFPANGDSMTFTNVPLFIVIMYLYNSDHPAKTQGLPDWTRSERYDIVAKVTGPDVSEYLKLTQAQRKLMLQKMLEDRFKLQIHRESKPTPVYELVIAKSGLKMQPAKPDDIPANGRTVFFSGRDALSGKGATSQDLAFALSDSGMDRQVLDKTGLTGKYTFTLRFTMNQEADAAAQETASSPNASAPSIFTALQEQLGLKLQPANAPVEYLVVDHVERPSEN